MIELADIPVGSAVEVQWLVNASSFAREPQQYRSCGYWLGVVGAGHVVIVLSWDGANGNVSSGMSIPLVAVQSVRRLEPEYVSVGKLTA